MPHCCPFAAIRDHAAKLIAELPSIYLQQAVITNADLDVAEAAWYKITHDKEVLSRFFDTFFRISEELQDGDIAGAHGKGLKTKSKFIVDVFGDCLKMLRAGNQDAINKLVEKNCHRYLTEMGLRVPHYIKVGQVMIRCFEECDNPYWNEESRAAWHKLVSVIVKLLIRIGLKVEAHLSPEELEAIAARVAQNQEAAIVDSSALSNESSRGTNKRSPEPSSSHTTETEASGGSVTDRGSFDLGSAPSPSPTAAEVRGECPEPHGVVYDDACWEG